MSRKWLSVKMIFLTKASPWLVDGAPRRLQTASGREEEVKTIGRHQWDNVKNERRPGQGALASAIDGHLSTKASGRELPGLLGVVSLSYEARKCRRHRLDLIRGQQDGSPAITSASVQSVLNHVPPQRISVERFPPRHHGSECVVNNSATILIYVHVNSFLLGAIGCPQHCRSR